MKFRSAFVDLLQSYDSEVVSCFISLPHDVYLSQNILSAGLPSPAFLEHLGGILLSSALVSATFHYGKLSPEDVANINATVYTRNAVYQTIRIYRNG